MMDSNTSIHSPTYVSDQTMTNTTFVQADPSNFKAVVQKLTGASEAEKLPHATQTYKATTSTRKPSFGLHQRRHTAKKLELSIGVLEKGMFFFNGGSEVVMASPVSPLEVVARSPQEEEERAIAEKGFYLHPSPRTTPTACHPPQLLPLFPLHSPTQNQTS